MAKSFVTTRTEAEIYDLLEMTTPELESGESKYWGMSYEDGIRETLYWLMDEEYGHPYREEEDE